MKSWMCILGCVSAASILMTGCSEINNNETIAAIAEYNLTTTTTAETTTTVSTTTTTTTTTVTTTTTTSPYRPFIDPDAEIDPDKPMVCLTFDDGPSEQTRIILDCLEEYNAHATFFVVGCNITEYNGDILNRAASLGCEIGSHTYNHTDLSKASAETIAQEVSDTDEKVYEHIGRYPYWLRPPYGAFDDESRLLIDKPQAFWSIDTLDWSTRNTYSTVSTILNNVEDGDIILMHDLYEATTAAALEVIPQLIDMGYQLVTMSEMAYYRDFELESGMLVINMHPDEISYYPVPETTTVTAAASDEDISADSSDTTETTTVSEASAS